VQTLLCTCNGTRHYPGTRHNYKIKDTKITEIHKPEGSALLTPHPPLYSIIFPISHFLQLALSVIVQQSQSRTCTQFLRGFLADMLYAVVRDTQPWEQSAGPRLRAVRRTKNLGRLSHSKVPTTAVSPLSSFNLKSEECHLSETLWVFLVWDDVQCPKY